MRQQNNCEDFSFSIFPNRPVKIGENLQIKAQISDKFPGITKVEILMNTYDNVIIRRFSLEKTEDNIYEANICLQEKGIYYYCFSFESDFGQMFVRYDSQNKCPKVTLEPLPYWHLEVGIDSPEWAKGANMMQIFVDRFRRSPKYEISPMPYRKIYSDWSDQICIWIDDLGNWNTDFFGGNLAGIEEMLDYIKRLGITIIYLTPIFQSQSNHRYDTGDYRKIDCYLGTEEDYDRLCKAVHKRGMHLILDGVFNHTGNDSWYFNEYNRYDSMGAYGNPDSPYKDWYKRLENGEYKYWWNVESLPECNLNNRNYQEYICKEVIRKRIGKDLADGMRFDVADQIPDFFLKIIVEEIYECLPNAFTVGEFWEQAMDKKDEYGHTRELIRKGIINSVMNYYWMQKILAYVKYREPEEMVERIENLLWNYPKGTIHSLMNFTCTHDMSRAITFFGVDCYKRNSINTWDLIREDDRTWEQQNDSMTKEQYKKGKNLLKVLLHIIAFLPGIVSIFYGDEVGVTGIGNLLNRKPYPWGRRDKELLTFVKKLLNTRKSIEWLKTAETALICVDERMMMFERYDDQNNLLNIVNITEHPIEVFIPELYKDGDIVYSYGKNNTKDKIDRYGCIVIQIEN